jgi:hypothetical protein
MTLKDVNMEDNVKELGATIGIALGDAVVMASCLAETATLKKRMKDAETIEEKRAIMEHHAKVVVPTYCEGVLKQQKMISDAVRKSKQL